MAMMTTEGEEMGKKEEKGDVSMSRKRKHILYLG